MLFWKIFLWGVCVYEKTTPASQTREWSGKRIWKQFILFIYEEKNPGVHHCIPGEKKNMAKNLYISGTTTMVKITKSFLVFSIIITYCKGGLTMLKSGSLT